MTPSWYDVLDVDEDATPAEIRTAWKAAIADLDPGDRRFRLANQAAEVLLDPDRRAAHDAELAEDDGPATPEAAPAAAVELKKEKKGATSSKEDRPTHTTPPSRLRSSRPKEKTEASTTDEPDADTSGAAMSRSVLALAVVALVLVVLTVVALVQGRGADDDGVLPTEKQVEDARGAAEAAVVPVLSYDYRSLEEDQAEAKTYLTEEYAKEYDRFFAAAVSTNAPRTKTVVRVRVLDTAIVRTGDDRVDVLVFVNRPTTNAQRSVEYRDQVTMRMLDVDGTWLVDCMVTTGTGPCEGD